MALIVHQTNGYSGLMVRDEPWANVVKLRCFIDFQQVGRADRLAPLKCHFQFRENFFFAVVRGLPVILPKERPFKVSSFKGNGDNGQNEGADGGDRDANLSKKPVQLSCTSHEREETGDVTSNSLSYAFGNGETTLSGSQAIEKLFKKWLIMLRTQALSEAMNAIYTKRTVESETSENQVGFHREKVENMWKVALMWFMGLDATIKIPLLIFIPWCLATRIIYGIEVTKALTPLWILGPFLVALYIKIIQGICLFSVFCFKHVSQICRKLSQLLYGNL